MPVQLIVNQMVEKKVQCPNCGKILTSSGSPGDVVNITCSVCGTEGKVTFEKPISTAEAAIEVSHLKKIYGDLIAVNDIYFAVHGIQKDGNEIVHMEIWFKKPDYFRVDNFLFKFKGI